MKFEYNYLLSLKTFNFSEFDMHDTEMNIFEGIWTIHFEDKKKLTVSGSLNILNYTLSTYCILNNENTIDSTRENKKFYVTGNTVTTHSVTLYGCFFITVKNSNFLNITEIRYNQALFGQELLSESIQKFNGIEFELSCFDSMSISENGITEKVKKYGFIQFLYYTDSNNKKRIKCSIDFDLELSLQESIDILHEIRCFFVFLYCKYVNIKYNYLKIKDHYNNTDIFLIHKTYSNKNTPNYNNYEILSRVGKNLFDRWAVFFDHYYEQIRPIFEIVTHDDIESDRSLVICIHAIEGFFRKISKQNVNLIDKRTDNDKFKKVKNEILNYIKSLKIDDEIYKNIKNSISYANEISLRDRINQLLTSYLGEKLRSYFIIHPIDNCTDIVYEYVSIIVGIRNYYAHLDPSNINSRITPIIENYLELYNYKVSLFSFLYTLLAKNYFNDDDHLLQRLSNNIQFPFSQQFYDERIKPIWTESMKAMKHSN